MKIAVISDIHLGRGDKADRKQGQDKALLKLLDYLELGYEQIILLGDIWELLTPKWPGNAKREIDIVRAAHPEVAQRFSKPPYTYVVGNHDQAIENLEERPQEICLQVDQIRMIFTHGHQFDIWAHQLRYISEFIVWFSGWSSRFGVQAITRFFDRLHNLITGVSGRQKLSQLERDLIQQSQKRKAHVTVIGHTHLPGITHVDGHLLVNSGHCLGNCLHFVSIDTEDDHLIVYRVKQRTGMSLSKDDLNEIDHAILSQINSSI